MLRFLLRDKTSRIAAVVGVVLSVFMFVTTLVVMMSVLQEHEEQLYEHELGRIGQLLRLGLITTEDVPRVLGEPGQDDFETGLKALSPFGYGDSPPEAFTNSYGYLLNSLMWAFTWSSVLLIVFWTFLLALITRKQCHVLRNIAYVLDNMMSGRYDSSPVLEGEGEVPVLYAQLDATARRFEKTIKELRAERNKIRSFISFISHELKTPTASLKTMNELMLEDSEMSRDQMNEFLSRCQNDIERMEWLIEDILNIARIEAGSAKFSFEKLDLGEIAEEVANRYLDIARSSNVTIGVSAESAVTVFCDKKWLSQAVDNLVKNAVDYSPAGGTVSIELISGDAYARLSVSDQGPGIPASESSKIFQGFYRGKNSSKRKKGSGLGLPLARAIVIRHGGDIRLKAPGEKGSTFIVELPTRGT